MRLPTDIKILNFIYKNYESDFQDFPSKNINRLVKNIFPIDIDLIAQKFKVDPDIIWGRLYWFLNEKYNYDLKNGETLSLFIERSTEPHFWVNYTYLSSILASLHQEENKNNWAIGIAIFSLIVSAVGLFF